MMPKTPLDRVVAAFGTVKAMAAATGIPASTIYRWGYKPKATKKGHKGGCGGRIPGPQQEVVLAAAQKAGVKLAPADLVVWPSQAGGHRRRQRAEARA